MDPLSITASIIAVLQATKRIISYVKETRDAPKELTKVYEEAKNLVILLYELKDSLAEQDPHNAWLRATSKLAVRDGPLDQDKKVLWYEQRCALTMTALLYCFYQGKDCIYVATLKR